VVITLVERRIGVFVAALGPRQQVGGLNELDPGRIANQGTVVREEKTFYHGVFLLCFTTEPQRLLHEPCHIT
jgi:hypothetical protein